ncbi:MAG: hypothetical protein K2N44_15265 [Lachnospiraceae bacterium]|nr:hypothetical protein [Lachnospiraceae bacterium]
MKRAIKVIVAVTILFIAVKYMDWKQNVYEAPQEEEWGSFTPDDVESFDGKFVAKQVVERRSFSDTQSINYVRVDVFDNESGELADSFYAERAWDFWGICWEKDSYNIWTQSADVGIYCYRYENGTWSRDENMERPEYIVSRWEAKAAAKEAAE